MHADMFSTCCHQHEPKTLPMTKLNHPCNFPVQQEEIFRGREGNWTPNEQELGANGNLFFWQSTLLYI